MCRTSTSSHAPHVQEAPAPLEQLFLTLSVAAVPKLGNSNPTHRLPIQHPNLHANQGPMLETPMRRRKFCNCFCHFRPLYIYIYIHRYIYAYIYIHIYICIDIHICTMLVLLCLWISRLLDTLHGVVEAWKQHAPPP